MVQMADFTQKWLNSMVKKWLNFWSKWLNSMVKMADFWSKWLNSTVKMADFSRLFGQNG